MAQAASNSLFEDASVSGNVGATDADDGAVLTYALTGAAPAGLTFHSDGSYTFDASSYDGLAEGEPLVLTIPFTATDEHLRDLGPGEPDDHHHRHQRRSGGERRCGDDGAGRRPAVGGSFSGDDVDSDDGGSSLTYTITSSPAKARSPTTTTAPSASIRATISRILPKARPRQVSFTYTATDVHGAVSNIGTVTVTVTGTNDDPIISLVDDDSAVATLDETDAGLAASGTLTVTDADTSNVVDSQVSSVALGGTTGGLVPADVLDMLTPHRRCRPAGQQRATRTISAGPSIRTARRSTSSPTARN